MKRPSRRQFLIGGSAVGGGLLLGYGLLSPERREVAGSIIGGEGAQLTTWVRIHPDNTVTFYVPHGEMGQGVHTALPMMAAEEMEADWDLVRMEQAPATPTFANGPLGKGYLTNGGGVPSALNGAANFATYKLAELMNLQITGGSTAVRFTGQFGMRVTGAAAKEMLIKAAAEKWGVAEEECTARLSHVLHEASGRKATFGELAELAAEFSPSANPVLKNKKDYTIVGTAKQRFDIPAKVTGESMYGIDVKVPGMLYAAIKQVPVIGGSVARVNDTEALAARGVRAVVTLEDGVAVVADNTWRAKQALDLLEVEFTDGGNGHVSSDSIFAQFDKALAENDGEEDVEKGEGAEALGSAKTVVEADYRVPFLAHATMEPMNCTVRIENGKCDVWIGTQDGLGTRAVAAQAAGLSDDDVTIHPLMMGGGFGRRSPGSPNHIIQAVKIAKEVGAPVKLTWSREDDMQHDYYRPAVSARMSAGFDEEGNLTTWVNRYIRKDEPAEASHIPYAVANQSIRYVESEVHIPYGPWRSVAHTQHTFFNESFADELAHAAGKDPYQFRRDLLKDQPRHLAVLDLAAKKANWGGPLPEGHARGIAVQESFQTIVAEVVEVSLDENGRPRVHNVTAAVDCGEVINTDTARAQVESGIIYGLTAALYGEITVENGAVVEENFPDYEMVRLANTPKMDVHFIESGAKLGGLGEPGTPPVAPALANALFSLTGQRIRSLPLKNHEFSRSNRLAQAAD
ncbi:molybdopterin-binding aldehyde oxidase and xanthine dehydrogenase [Tepidicaulis marinus]|uniref:Molybdopterin-binding aldehyde oxidase and xanthine dehydrogenase n=1 Tax=Tepidicaulis marinus TaxID=1333998 RepID=A0A081BE39_9HYPH|nr:molybdopterin cofactor-binding domain-containing protein [Tepidicaulis marinus]GAK46307.1 molybdopterin-binding aldehyde oxidase and xanthine dehydrogenase [Tepidicaulis marinus]